MMRFMMIPRPVILGALFLGATMISPSGALARTEQPRNVSGSADEVVRAEHMLRTGKRDEARQLLAKLARDPRALRARVLLGGLLIESGKRDEARAYLMQVIEAYNRDDVAETDAAGLSLVGRAAHLLRAFKDANQAYSEAERAGGNRDVETLLWRGELLFEKYNYAEAGKIASEALQLDEGSPDALVLLARVVLASSMDFQRAHGLLDRALAGYPKHLNALAVRAALLLRTEDREGARKIIEQGLGIDATHSELVSMAAAVAFLQGDGVEFARREAAALATNRADAMFYVRVAELVDWDHRYEELSPLLEKAVQLDPREGRAFAALGMNLIRLGDDAGGLAYLRKAFAVDPYNVRTLNVLNLYEKKIPRDYTSESHGPFTIRMSNAEAPLMRGYVTDMLDAAYKSMVERYGFEPKKPIGIELYSDVEAFSVRTAGLPNVGIQGVCFGRTLAALSAAAGPVNWGNILWHELGHVFAIQASSYRVPRWFTEGLSETETNLARPEWRREEDRSLALAWRRHDVPPIAKIPDMFTSARSFADMTLAYYLSGLVVGHIVEQDGFGGIRKMLAAWAASKTTEEVVRDALGLTMDELDARFRRSIEKRIAPYQKQYLFALDVPESVEEAETARTEGGAEPSSSLRVALAMGRENQSRTSDDLISRLLSAYPQDADVRFVALGRALRAKEPKRAREHFEALLALGHDGYDVRMAGVALATLEDRPEDRLEHLKKAAAWDVLASEPRAILAQRARRLGLAGEELSWLREVTALEQADSESWIRRLKLELRQGNDALALRAAQDAAFIAPLSPEFHFQFGRALARSGQGAAAIHELNLAVRSQPDPALLQSIYVSLAAGYDRLGHPDFASQARAMAAEAGANQAP